MPMSRRRPTPKLMITRAVDTFGRLDVLYNNAGVMLDDDGSVDVAEESIWDTTLAINVKGVAFGCKYGIPAMIATGGGSIVKRRFVRRHGWGRRHVPDRLHGIERGGTRDDARDRGRVRAARYPV